MTLCQSFGGLTAIPRRNASSGEKAYSNGLSDQSGKWRVVPSARRNGFQPLSGLAGVALGICRVKVAENGLKSKESAKWL